LSLLEVTDLRATYGQGHVLHGISFAVDEGQIVSVLGPNGAGKTTTLRAVSGTVSTTGRIVLDGSDIRGWSPDKIARQGIAHVPEGRGTFTELTVEENLRVGAYTRKNGVREDIARCYEWFPRLGERRTQHAVAVGLGVGVPEPDQGRSGGQQGLRVPEDVVVHAVLDDLGLGHRDDPDQRAGPGGIDDRHRPLDGPGPPLLGRGHLVAAHVAHRGAPPVREHLVVAGVEAEVLEAGGCVSHEAAG
jgi:ABC-type sugar transport system ATPase subunit